MSQGKNFSFCAHNVGTKCVSRSLLPVCHHMTFSCSSVPITSAEPMGFTPQHLLQGSISQSEIWGIGCILLPLEDGAHTEQGMKTTMSPPSCGRLLHLLLQEQLMDPWGKDPKHSHACGCASDAEQLCSSNDQECSCVDCFKQPLQTASSGSSTEGGVRESSPTLQVWPKLPLWPQCCLWDPDIPKCLRT